MSKENSAEQHVIELDDFEENAQQQDDQPEDTNNDAENASDENIDDSATSTDGDAEDSEDSEKSKVEDNDESKSDNDDIKPNADKGDVSQELVEKIIHARLMQRDAKHSLALEKERQESAKLKKELDDLRNHQESESERQKKLNEAIEKDSLADDDVKSLSKPVEFTPPTHSVGVHRFPISEPDLLRIQADELDIKMREQWGDSYQINAMKVAQAIKSGVLHHDVLTLANKHKNGTKFLDTILTDESVYNELALAGYQSSNFDEYSLKFNELASSIESQGSNKVDKTTPRKEKPEPNKVLRQAPSAGNLDDDDVVYID